jgi:hypothetical protein
MATSSKSTTATKPRKEASAGTQQMVAEMRPSEDIVEYLKEYARERPEVAALWCLGIGFIVGWKLKPW